MFINCLKFFWFLNKEKKFRKFKSAQLIILIEFLMYYFIKLPYFKPKIFFHCLTETDFNYLNDFLISVSLNKFF